jgi:hypothetical protein
MRTALALLITLIVLISTAQAEVAPVAVRAPDAKAWVGQRVPFYVELRATGSFAGVANFDLPQLPGTIIMKIGNPVVSSQEIEGQSWFVQTHEFALFSQKPGRLDMPAFAVRFSSRDGFTGPVKDQQVKAPSWSVEIERPPGSEKIGFLITTETLDVKETWDPQPGPVQVGAVFKRSIVQRAPELSGMALAPAPTTAPDGIRVYSGNAETKDRIDRGSLSGERRDTLTYLLTKPGTFTLPALAYVWWNPKTQTLQSKTLPAVTFDVAPAPIAQTSKSAVARGRLWPWLLALALVAAIGAWQWRRFVGWGRQAWKKLNPPDRVATRKLLRACRHNDAAAAEAAWIAWRNTQDAAFEPDPKLRSAILELQRCLFGPTPAMSWQGDTLARAFSASLNSAKASRQKRKSSSALPQLNPQA